ncbi:hypothetical protein EVAR_68976_1 [Eumeta japonica]|uniref:Uncharacterized protein n=1 Tax=Eumeta variegata TaxID=151549 RepID=A0A4C2A2C8_EUMVA|nr:hypothetical protein EVAR_68976_1 [Eumeta japonica]
MKFYCARISSHKEDSSTRGTARSNVSSASGRMVLRRDKKIQSRLVSTYLRLGHGCIVFANECASQNISGHRCLWLLATSEKSSVRRQTLGYEYRLAIVYLIKKGEWTDREGRGCWETACRDLIRCDRNRFTVYRSRRYRHAAVGRWRDAGPPAALCPDTCYKIYSGRQRSEELKIKNALWR